MFRCLYALAAGAVLSGAALAGAGEPPPVEFLLTGDGAVTGRLSSIEAGRVTLVRDRAEKVIPLDSLREIVFGKAAPRRLPVSLTIWLDDGSQLMVRQTTAGATPGTTDLIGHGWRATGLPLGRVRAVATRRLMRGAAEAREEFETARDAPPVGEDHVMLQRNGEQLLIPCAVESLTGQGIDVSAGQSRRAVPWSDVLWVVLSPATGQPKERQGHLLELAHGSRVHADALELADGALIGESGEMEYRIDPGAVLRLRVRSDAYRYLSDMEPAHVSSRPFVDVVWAPRLDRAVSGGPLTLGGKTYPKGLGMHARTEMTFALGGAYSQFHTLVGVDDSAGRLGHVVFRVHADDEVVYESDPMRGGDTPLTLALDVTAAQTLTVAADFGDPLIGSGNFADWADARVVR